MKYYAIKCVDSNGITIYSINTKQDGTGFSLNIYKDLRDYDEARFICNIANEAVSLSDYLYSK